MKLTAQVLKSLVWPKDATHVRVDIVGGKWAVADRKSAPVSFVDLDGELTFGALVPGEKKGSREFKPLAVQPKAVKPEVKAAAVKAAQARAVEELASAAAAGKPVKVAVEAPEPKPAPAPRKVSTVRRVALFIDGAASDEVVEVVGYYATVAADGVVTVYRDDGEVV